EAFVEELSQALDRLELPSGHVARVEKVRLGIGALKSVKPPVGQRLGKRVVDQMAVLQASVAMLEELEHRPDDRARAAALDFILARDVKAKLEPPSPLDAALLD